MTISKPFITTSIYLKIKIQHRFLCFVSLLGITNVMTRKGALRYGIIDLLPRVCYKYIKRCINRFVDKDVEQEVLARLWPVNRLQTETETKRTDKPDNKRPVSEQGC